ncbi:MAG: biotin--[acetyl-CoA-carboxylase] ligase [Vicingaceae bacterium]|nr:biotin--[acetyl-CoA-carboxylase] ligase [Vicingaceae bacterium]
MNQRLIIGNKLIHLPSIDSTNVYLKELISDTKNEAEGIVIVADEQLYGVGQRGNKWESEAGLNLTFSILLKPNLNIDNQFDISKIVSIALIEFFHHYGVIAKIKWPNDIYVGNEKIGGMLIENAIRDGKVVSSIVGIGLNINQQEFNINILNPTSLKLQTNDSYKLKETLKQVLNFIDSHYLKFKTTNVDIEELYLKYLYRFNELNDFEIEGKTTSATIVGINKTGKLQIKVNNEIKSFGLKEVKFLF